MRLSATSLEDFFFCPKRYWFRQNYTPARIPQYFSWGIEAHRIMEGTLAEADATEKAIEYARRLKEIEQEWGFEIVDRELKEEFYMPNGMEVIRIIDGVGKWGGQDILIDYKTASQPWSTVETMGGTVAPKALGFQAALYLYQSDFDTIAFVISNGDVHFYSKNEEDEKNLVHASYIFEYAVERNLFPKVRGNRCTGDGDYACPYQEICYQVPGWEKRFKEK